MFLRVLAWLNAKKNLCVAPLGLDIACFIGTHVFRRGLNNFAPLALGSCRRENFSLMQPLNADTCFAPVLLVRAEGEILSSQFALWLW